MPHIPDYSDAELDTMRTLLKQRYDENIEAHLADAEVRLAPDSDELIQCPAAYWYARQCNFIIQAQSDHKREREGVTSGTTGGEIH